MQRIRASHALSKIAQPLQRGTPHELVSEFSAVFTCASAHREFLVALLKLIFLIPVLLLALLLRLWEWLLEAIKSKNLYSEDQDDPCGQLPEAIIRRPDPAIYSQRLLQSQGLPVTWNNPDIWVARVETPGNIEPDSYHLVEDTDYIVSVRVHNAGTDAAIGVRVRLNYRPWSFNSPDLAPVETDAGGNEVARFVDISPLSSAVTTFNWHTPSVLPGQQSRHFCLQASLFHPMDTNMANNMGQENTNVWQSENPGFVGAGEVARVEVPLFNFARQPQRFRFDALRYEVDLEETFELKLKTTYGYARRSLSHQTANVVPTLHPRRRASQESIAARTDSGTASLAAPGFWSRFSFQAQPSLVAVKNRYVGFEQIRERILERDNSLLPDMAVTVDGQTLEEGIEVASKEQTIIPFDIKMPDDALPGSKYPITLLAHSEEGVLAGGVTVILSVREG